MAKRPKGDKRRLFIIIMALVMAFLMVFFMISSAFYALAAPSQSSVNNLRNKLSKIAEENEMITKQLGEIADNKKEINQKKQAVDKQLLLAESQIEVTSELINGLNGEISKKREELDAAEKNEDEQYKLFKERVRSMYENGQTSYLGILLNSNSFSDFLTRYEIVTQIVTYDRNLIKKLNSIKEEIKSTKADLESDLTEQANLKKSLEETKVNLQKQSNEQQAIIDDLNADEVQFRKAYEENEKEEAKLNNQIKKMLADLAKKSGAYIGGVFTWPVPSSYKISSEFGTRFHPILKVTKLHTGVDISAPKGTTVVAANSGTVITATYNSAYGNYIIISHGGGIATLYAHLSKILVNENESVKKGQEIGKVGATGFATGPHLHFEVRKNGDYVNPMTYFKKS